MSAIPPRASHNLMAMSTRFALFVLVICTVGLAAGCIPIPLLPSSEVHETENDIDELLNNNASRSDVIKSLGHPVRQYGSVMSYKVCRKTAGFGYIMCVGYQCAGDDFRGSECFELVLEFDDSDYLAGYKKLPFEGEYKTPDEKMMEITKTMVNIGIPESQWKPQVELGIEAEEIIWMHEMKMHTVRSMAEEGSAEHQWMLYNESSRKSEDIHWLCRSADNGYAKAQLYVGHLYWGASNIRQNKVKAYVWYKLAATGDKLNGLLPDKNTQNTAWLDVYNTEKILTTEQMKVGRALYTKWQPGQCEQDLAPKIPSN